MKLLWRRMVLWDNYGTNRGQKMTKSKTKKLLVIAPLKQSFHPSHLEA
jgi:hypothetical protein